MTWAIRGQLASRLNGLPHIRSPRWPKIWPKPLLANFALAVDAPVALDWLSVS